MGGGNQQTKLPKDTKLFYKATLIILFKKGDLTECH